MPNTPITTPAKRAMNKTRQQELTRWLKQQSIISRRWLMISRLLGVASGLLIVAQAWFLARILHRMVMENIPATALLLPLTLLVLIFVLRAWWSGCVSGSAFRPGSIFAMKFAARFLTASSRQARRGSGQTGRQLGNAYS
nr:ATP-binding/permease protein CydD [Klebsiella pneumoniae]